MMYEKTKWVRVRKGNPCVVCNKSDWCSVSDDGATAFCMRVASDKPVETKAGTGYLHKLTDDVRQRIKPAKRIAKKTARLTTEQWFELAMRFRAGVDLKPLADELGLSVRGLECFEVGYGMIEYHNADGEPFHMKGWTWPMRKGTDAICGIRTRHGTFKGSYIGSEPGLFLPDTLRSGMDLIVAEGATDPIALHDIGLNAIGRASCSSNVDDIIVLINRIKPERLIIVSDNDTGKQRPDGTLWFPGQEGSRKLAESTCDLVETRIIKPLRCKDSREWVKAGLTLKTFEAVVKLSSRVFKR